MTTQGTTESAKRGALPREVPVLIVGGGGCGLAASVMLGDLGASSLLVERHPGTALMPKAHILNPRTMEILAQHGLAEEVYRRGAPHENNRAAHWYTGLGPGEPWDGQKYYTVDAWSGGALREHYRPLTAYRHGNLPQNQLEPFLLEEATAREAGGIGMVRYNHELTALEQGADGVRATILDRSSGESSVVEAHYVVGADGGKTIGAMLGIGMLGPAPFVQTISVYFRADLSRYLHEDDACIRLLVRPTVEGAWTRTGLLAMAAPWDRRCPEWVTTITLPPGASQDVEYDEPMIIDAMRTRLGLPDLEIEILRHSRWSLEGVLAERYTEGRIHLAGDAAHRHSPMGGLGLNSGIQDAHNLAWKLAAVVGGTAAPALLDSYEPERRPVGARNVEFATFAFFNHLAVSAGFGAMPGAPPDHNAAAYTALFSDTADGATRRARLEGFMSTLRMEFSAADIELGFSYADSPAVVPDGTPAPPRDPAAKEYRPTTRPGHRLPHAWLERYGRMLSTHELVTPGTFVLLTGDEAEPWLAAADEVVRAAGVDLRVHPIGPHADLRDREDAWGRLRGHDETGAVLVRPDGHCAWRAAHRPAVPADALRDALRVALGHEAAAPALAG